MKIGCGTDEGVNDGRMKKGRKHRKREKELFDQQRLQQQWQQLQ